MTPVYSHSLLFALLASVSPAAAALAQQAVPPTNSPTQGTAAPQEGVGETADADVTEEPEIVVTGRALRGAVIGDIPPETSLDRADIAAYGASNIAELLEALSPQTRSGRGRGEGGPVVLLNGRRVSGFSEIRDLPPEAIQRVDVLPEEVALKYGYRADQRVVNFVLVERFRAITGELEGGLATAGGRGHYEADFNILRITDKGRWTIDMEVERDDPLFESERDILQPEGRAPFDLIGNVTSVTEGGEIDPALSALAGTPVTVAAVPGSAGGLTPGLGAFASGANDPNVTDIGRFRTLLPAQTQFTLSGNINRTLFGNVSTTLDARFEESGSESRFGLASGSILLPANNPFSPFAADVLVNRYSEAFGPLTRESTSRSGHLGLSMNGDISSWRWSFTGAWDRNSSDTITDRSFDPALIEGRLAAGDPALNPFGPYDASLVAPSSPDRARSVTQAANAELVANGTLLDLPAGDLSTTVRAGFETRGFESEATRAGVITTGDLSRDRASGQVNVDLPIASRRREVLGAIGDLSANANLEVERLSDFGTLTTFGYGINWEPIDELRLLASVTEEEGAPSVQQLGNPVLQTPNARVFDFTRGETVDITRIEGGNPALTADSRRVFKLGLNLQPLEETDLRLSADYISTKIERPIASFPTATPEIEAAFPERFVRDDGGRLLRIDSRPVNFERSDTRELRWGINFSKPLAAPERPDDPERQARREARQAARGQEGAAPGGQGQRRAGQGGGGGQGQGGWRGGGGGGGPGGGGFGRGRFGGGGREGRIQLSLYHTWRFKDEILIREGVPVLDLLNGSAVGSRGGRSAHELEFQAGVFKNGFGGRLTANWQSATFVRGDITGAASDDDLFFSDFATVNLRLFADLGQQRALVRKHRWLRGARVSLFVSNLLDSRLEVRDGAGTTPISYQPDLLDPLGRSIRVSFRKLFF